MVDTETSLVLEFESWFKSKYGFSPFAPGSTVSHELPAYIAGHESAVNKLIKLLEETDEKACADCGCYKYAIDIIEDLL